MRVIYVAGPFRGRDSWEIESNIRRAEALSLEVWKAGGVALCPHANTRFFQGTLPDDTFVRGTLEMLTRCDAILMVPGWERSAGARGERDWAIEHAMPVFYSAPDLTTWLSDDTQPAALAPARAAG
jgi:hypothetical protein